MPNVGFQAVAEPSSYNPHQQPLLAYPNYVDIKEEEDYVVEVVFVEDPLNFYCRVDVDKPDFCALIERLSTVYSGKSVLHFPSCEC